MVFYGTMDGWFKAVDARNGKILWQQKLASGIVGNPMTYVGPGRQAICGYLCGNRRLDGRGGAAGSLSPTTITRPWE